MRVQDRPTSLPSDETPEVK